MLNIILGICGVCSVVAVGFDIAGFDMTKIFLTSGIVAMGLFIIKVIKEKKWGKIDFFSGIQLLINKKNLKKEEGVLNG